MYHYLRACGELHVGGATLSDFQPVVAEGMAEIELELLRAASLTAKLRGHPALVRALLADAAEEADVPLEERATIEEQLLATGGRRNISSADGGQQPAVERAGAQQCRVRPHTPTRRKQKEPQHIRTSWDRPRVGLGR